MVCIAGKATEGSAYVPIQTLHVNEIQIDIGIDKIKALKGFIARTVPNNGDCKPLCFGKLKGPDDGGNEMGPCDQIDVCRTLLLELDHQDTELFYGDDDPYRLLPPLLYPRDLVVLTKGAVQGASTEEDHPRSMLSCYRRLFPSVQPGPGHPHTVSFPTDADFTT